MLENNTFLKLTTKNGKPFLLKVTDIMSINTDEGGNAVVSLKSSQQQRTCLESLDDIITNKEKYLVKLDLD